LNRFLHWLLYGCLAVAVLLLATGIFLYWQGSGDPNNWRQVEYEHNHSDAWLNKCPQQEVRMQWCHEEGWIDNLTIDLQAKTISGSSGDGISFSGPFAMAMATEKPQGPTLTEDQISQIKDALTHLPPGKNRPDRVPDFSQDFRVAFYQNGAVQVRHYPGDHVPEPIVQLGNKLLLHFPQQKNN